MKQQKLPKTATKTKPPKKESGTMRPSPSALCDDNNVDPEAMKIKQETNRKNWLKRMFIIGLTIVV